MWQRRARRKNQAISEMLSVILIILIVISVATLILGFATTGLGSLASGFSSLLSGEGSSLSQKLSIEQIGYQYSSGLQYVPITINNAQTSATSAPFQQKLVIDPALYSSLESTDLGNIRFYSSISGGVLSGALYSWLESYSGSSAPNTATSAIFWVDLPNGIGAQSSLTLYMAFQSAGVEFDGNFAGEAPNLSPSYAQYDNGANVFLAYFDGNTPTSSFSEFSGFSLTQSTGVPYTTGTVNALVLIGYNSGNPALVFNTGIPNEPLSLESNVQDPNSVNPGTDTGHVGLVDSATASSVSNGVGTESGYGQAYFNLDYLSGGTYFADFSPQGSSVTTWTYSNLNYSGPSGASFQGDNAPQLYSTSGGYSGTVNTNPFSSSGNLYLGLLCDTTSTYSVNLYINWMRARAAPPSGIMPAETVGSLTGGIQPGANLYLRNTGSNLAIVSAVYVQNITSNTLVESYQLSSPVNIQPGAFAIISVPFEPSHGQTYSFTIATTLGYSAVAQAPA